MFFELWWGSGFRDTTFGDYHVVEQDVDGCEMIYCLMKAPFPVSNRDFLQVRLIRASATAWRDRRVYFVQVHVGILVRVAALSFQTACVMGRDAVETHTRGCRGEGDENVTSVRSINSLRVFITVCHQACGSAA